MFFNDLFEDDDKSLKKNNPCWKGYHPVGTKQKAGKTVPNCVPEDKALEEGAMKDLHTELADKYQELAPKIERHRDSYLAGELYDALEEIAARHGAMAEFRRMLNGARNRAHMDYDTNPGGFQNWFWYLPFADDQLDEFAPGGNMEPPVPPKTKKKDPWEDDDRSIYPRKIQQLLAAGNTVDSRVPGAQGHVFQADDLAIRMKRLNKPYSQKRYAWYIDADRDDTLVLKQVRPGHYVLYDRQWMPQGPVVEAGLGMWGDKSNDNKKSKAVSDLERTHNKKKQADQRASAEQRDRAWWKAQDDAAKAGKSEFEFDGKKHPLKGKGVAEDTKSDLYTNAVKKIKAALATAKDPQVRSELEARLAKFQTTESQLNELDPKQEEPATIDDRVKDLTARIGQLEKDAPKTRRGEVSGLEKTSYGQVKDPAVKRLLRKAHELAPYASNDLEAVFRYFEKVVEKDDETIDMLVKNHKRNAALIKFLNQENDRQEQEIQQGNQIDAEQEKKIKDLLDLMNAKEKRFQDYTTLVARSRGEYPQDMVRAAQTAQHVERTGRMPDEESAPQGQQQANRQLQQSRYSREPAIRESVLDSVAHYYFKPIGTLPNDLTRVYGLEKDAKGWYLKQTGVSSTDFKNKLSAARRAFGEPEVVRQDMPVSRSGFSRLDRAGWQDKLSYARELERHPSMQDPILHQNVLNRIQELTKIGHDNGWM